MMLMTNSRAVLVGYSWRSGWRPWWCHERQVPGKADGRNLLWLSWCCARLVLEHELERMRSSLVRIPHKLHALVGGSTGSEGGEACHQLRCLMAELNWQWCCALPADVVLWCLWQRWQAAVAKAWQQGARACGAAGRQAAAVGQRSERRPSPPSTAVVVRLFR